MHADTVLARAAAPVRLAAAGLIVALCTLPAAANDVLKWNDTTVKAVTMGGQNPIQQSRTVAMVQGAVHDALNAIEPRYRSYATVGAGNPNASPEAAVASAARGVLVGTVDDVPLGEREVGEDLGAAIAGEAVGARWAEEMATARPRALPWARPALRRLRAQGVRMGLVTA